MKCRVTRTNQLTPKIGLTNFYNQFIVKTFGNDHGFLLTLYTQLFHINSINKYLSSSICSPNVKLTSLYSNTQRIADRLSNMLFIGFQLDVFKNETTKVPNKIILSNLILYNTIFYALLDNLTVALEMRTHIDLVSDQSFIVFYPQLDFNFGPNFEFQTGLGLFFTKDKFIPQFVHRPTLAYPTTVPNPQLIIYSSFLFLLLKVNAPIM